MVKNPWDKEIEPLHGRIYCGAQGTPHEEHRIIVQGNDGLFPNHPDRWFVRCLDCDTRWGTTGDTIRASEFLEATRILF